MMARKMYEIGDEYLEILEAFEFAETDEEISALEMRLKNIDEEHDTKGENLCAFIKTLAVLEKEAEAQRKVFSDLAEEWAKKRDARKNKRARVSEYMKGEMEKLGFEKRRYGNYPTWFIHPESVNILDADAVPNEYRRPGAPNLTLIKEDIKGGAVLEFAELLEKKTLVVG